MSLVSKRTPHAHGSSKWAIPTSIYINQNAVNAMSLPWIIYDPIKPDKCTNFYKTISRWLKSRNIRKTFLIVAHQTCVKTQFPMTLLFGWCIRFYCSTRKFSSCNSTGWANMKVCMHAWQRFCHTYAETKLYELRVCMCLFWVRCFHWPVYWWPLFDVTMFNL